MLIILPTDNHLKINKFYLYDIIYSLVYKRFVLTLYHLINIKSGKKNHLLTVVNTTFKIKHCAVE